MSTWSDWVSGELQQIRAADRWRATTAFEGNSIEGRVHGREVINFASNDYLGLSMHVRVRAAAIQAIERWGTGASASRLVTGTRTLHHELEERIARWQGTERALVFPTGYAANLGVLQVCGGADVTIFSDKLNHASIIDGCRHCRARVLRFRHNDLEHLQALMREVPGRKLLVTEAVFSMDGDRAPLEALEELCERHSMLLVVDEAHAVLEQPRRERVGLPMLRVGTLSKTLGALGGWVAGPAAMIDLLVNRARTFIFTTATTPADAAAAAAALDVYCSSEGAELRKRLRTWIDLLRPGHPSAILPIVLGEESAALSASSRLLEAGLYVPAIRPPTVPLGTSRLRVTLSAAHTQEMVTRLRSALQQVAHPALVRSAHE